MNDQLQSPILFLVFNRPYTTLKVFEQIRKAKPTQLFVAADGPRPTKPGEKMICEETRSIATKVDWDCEVLTLFSEENKGCGKAVSDAITWFFEHVEEGIILEDDCLPSNSFFSFCEILLAQYRFDDRIHSIGGTNLLKQWNPNKASYIFTNYVGVWGWATWRRVWNEYDFLIKKWAITEIRNAYLNTIDNADEKYLLYTELDKIFHGERHTWDYQWVFSSSISGRFGIVPTLNLISNIGFGKDATHTKNVTSLISGLDTFEIQFPLVSPQSMLKDKDFEDTFSKKFFPAATKTNIYRTLINFVNNIRKRKT